VTDCPPEFHEGKRGGKLRPKEPKLIKQAITPITEGQHAGQYRLVTTMPRHMQEAEERAFMEAEEEAKIRPKTLKELSIARGNVGHEVTDEDDDMESLDGAKSVDKELDGAKSVDETPLRDGSSPLPGSPERKGPSPSPEAQQAYGSSTRVLRQSASSASSEKEKSPPQGQKRERRKEEGGGLESSVERKAKQAKSTKKERPPPESQAQAVASVASPNTKGGVPLFARVAVKTDAAADPNQKGRVTGVEDNRLEVVTEGGYRTLQVGMEDVSLIDETQFVISSAKISGPSDFGFLFDREKEKLDRSGSS